MSTQNEAKKHHYIPQFILRNFLNDKGQLYYWNLKLNRLEERNPKSIFMNIDMYRDELNHSDNPTFIETTLSKFEMEISDLIKNRFLNSNKVIITRAELEKLRIYLTLQSFRDNHRKGQYVNNSFDKATREVLSEYAVNDNFEDLWKREIEAIAQCRSYQDIQESKVIDPIIKMEFNNDWEGYFMSIVDVRGGEMLISDVYPTLELYEYEIYNTPINIHLHEIIPISPTRVILLNHIMFKSNNVNEYPFASLVKLSKIKGDMIVPPRNEYKYGPNVLSREDKYIYTVRKIYASDVQYLNSLILNEARQGIMFRDFNKISASVREYNALDYKKQSYEKLEEELCRLNNN